MSDAPFGERSESADPAAERDGDRWQPSQRQRDRDAYRRSRVRRSGLISAASTLVFVLVVALAVRSSPGWPRVRESFFDFHRGLDVLPGLLEALWTNIKIMLISEVLILVFALAVAWLRTLPGPAFFPLRAAATAYVDVMRGLPLLLVLFVVGYGLPALRLKGAPDSPFVLGIIALVLTYTAYVAEVFRAGIESVHPSQRAAARSLGLTQSQTMRHVVFPQAVRRVLPPLLNDFVSLQKDTSLISILGVGEIILTAQNDTAEDFKFVPYVMAGLVFVVLTIPLARFTDGIGRRQGWRGVGGAVL